LSSTRIELRSFLLDDSTFLGNSGCIYFLLKGDKCINRGGFLNIFENVTFSDFARLVNLVLPALMTRTFIASISVFVFTFRMSDCMVAFKFNFDAIAERRCIFSANVPFTFSTPASLILASTLFNELSLDIFSFTPNCLANAMSRCFSVFNLSYFVPPLRFRFLYEFGHVLVTVIKFTHDHIFVLCVKIECVKIFNETRSRIFTLPTRCFFFALFGGAFQRVNTFTLVETCKKGILI